MLTFVGLGLHDERSVTVRGRAVIADATHVFAETYTSRLAGTDLDDLAAVHGVPIEHVDREVVEGDPSVILDAAAEESVAFLTGGDPMSATTHVDLRLRAAEREIATRIVHGPSIVTAAAGLAGLQTYRFGKATTLPFPGTFAADVPASVAETYTENFERGHHTLVLLDLEDTGAALDAATAAGALAESFAGRLGVVVARAGSGNPVVIADRLEVLAARSYGPPLHVLVLPGTLHPMEAEALATFADAPTDLLDAHRDG